MTYVSVNAHNIQANAKHGRNDPLIRVARTRSDSKPPCAREIKSVGRVTVIYSPDCLLLKCGARLVNQYDGVKIIR
jgi:hypothetical protein